MDYKWFVFIFVAGVFFTVFLAACKFIGRARLSWFAVPWPLFIAIAILGGPYILAVLMADL